LKIEHYENFPVASVLCPPALRPAVAAIYHFARTADDIADEGPASTDQRLADLAAYRRDLDCVLGQRAPGPRWPRVFRPLARCCLQFDLPGRLLHDLLDAFEQDVRNPRYATRAEVLDYCRRSANPVGRLLLHLWGYSDAQALRRSDAICTSLQLINFWQDLGVDVARARHYVPDADLREHGVTRDELATGIDTPRSRALVAALCRWAAETMREGAPLALQVPGRAGWELRLVVQGGLGILGKIEGLGHATLATRPKLSAIDGPMLLWRAWRMAPPRP
jgi:squalene synthase HpnC